MKTTMGYTVLLTAVLTVTPADADAQHGMRSRGGMTMDGRGAGVEMILRQRQHLELTENQVQQLDRIRQEAVQRRSAQQAQMAELRSRILAGQMEPAALREQMQAIRSSADEVRKAQGERVESVLNEAQRQKLTEQAGRARAFRMGRESALRGGRGGGSGPGSMRGMRGQRGGWDGPGMRGRMPAQGMRGFRGEMGPMMRQRWMRGGGMDPAGDTLEPQPGS